MAKFRASFPVLLTDMGSDDFPSSPTLQIEFEAANREEATGILRGAFQEVIGRVIRDNQVPDDPDAFDGEPDMTARVVLLEGAEIEHKIRVWGSEEKAPLWKSFTVNGSRFNADADSLTYESIARLCLPWNSDRVLSVTYYLPGTKGGEVPPGGSVKLVDGMHFNVSDTSNA